MFCLGSTHRYYLYDRPCDMRKSFNGLGGIVRSQLQRDPTCGDVFIFINKTGRLIKLLHWEEDGFVLYYKRLEQGTFSRPRRDSSGYITWPDLVLMIQGIEVQGLRQKKRYQHRRVLKNKL